MTFNKYLWNNSKSFLAFIVTYQAFIGLCHLVDPLDFSNFMIAESCLVMFSVMIVTGDYFEWKKKNGKNSKL